MRKRDAVRTIVIHRLKARALLGDLAERTFAKLEAEGIIVPTVRGVGRRPSEYDPFVIAPAYIGYLKSSTGGADREARARRDRSQAELTELRIKKERRDVLPRDQVVRDGQAALAAVGAKLLAIPRRMVQSGLIALEQQPAVADFIRETLEEMSGWRTRLELLRAAKGDA